MDLLEESQDTGVSKQSTHEALDEESTVKIKNKKIWGDALFFTFSLSHHAHNSKPS